MEKKKEITAIPPAPEINISDPHNPETTSRELEAVFTPWVDWLLGRCGKSPEITDRAKLELEIFDDDIKAGKIARNFILDEAANSITPISLGANNILSLWGSWDYFARRGWIPPWMQ